MGSPDYQLLEMPDKQYRGSTVLAVPPRHSRERVICYH